MLRDDLLHPVLGGNKVRKLDALLPELRHSGVTDVVTCGGVQSAHTAAVAVAAAELGLRSHLLIRGEAPQIPTGYQLVTRMYGSHVSYVTRAEYADRATMFARRVEHVRQQDGAAEVAVIAEGGGDAAALLGLLRLAHWLLAASVLAPAGGHPAGGASSRLVRDVEALPDPHTTPYRIIVDSGTGTTAIGLAIAVAALGLPWTVVGVMLAGDEAYYRAQAEQLLGSFLGRYGAELYIGAGAEARAAAPGPALNGSGGGAAGSAAEAASECLPLQWVARSVPRRFGKVFPQDLAACMQVARSYGIGLDPIYSLSAWELACQEAEAAAAATASDAHVGPGGGGLATAPIVMLHGGGALGLHGLAQRYPDAF
ncbi:hypothetical protein HYH02_005726 [Chlamydomonas schloesseri]|uniref:Tryptophan synthase beta chain-like PALP domain-containing protein n=1 Tax=Chlamydomonas schloesseri TaxID=2026947 RepID=A0A836B6F7_9CHLO|nr:hypothetical protein HYH02_005726 [Chlamydomonas schloesseri]|eukprot:KAG2448972.1 hypothetical protein HYH02_005726 [Chlamydomonas schloesseri]